MNKSIERQIKQIYNEVFKKVFSEKRLNSLSKGFKIDIEASVYTLKNSDKYNEFCKKFAQELAKKGLSSQKGIWRRYFEAARKSHYIGLPKTFNEFETKILQESVVKNFNMIKSIPDKMLDLLNHKYSNTLIQEVAEGKLNRGTFKKKLEKHGITNAKMIARTETAKLQTDILKSRATNLGSKCYIWLSSNDRRTRISHKVMNGVLVFWDNNPTFVDITKKRNTSSYQYGPGQFVNCRCSPEPVFDLDDITFPIKVAENAVLTSQYAGKNKENLNIKGIKTYTKNQFIEKFKNIIEGE